MTNTTADSGPREQIRCWPYLLLGIFLPIVSFPLVLAMLVGHFRRHVDRRLQSSIFRSERFATPQGQDILRRLRKCRGWFRNPALVVLLIQYILCPSLIGFQMAVVPLLVRDFDYSEVAGTIASVQRVRKYHDPPTRAAYEALPKQRVWFVAFELVRELEGDDELPLLDWQSGSFSGAPVSRFLRFYDAGPLPYEGRCKAEDGKWYVARAIVVGLQWEGTIVLGLILYCVFIPLQIISAMALCCGFWLRFARHRQLEVLACAHAQGDAQMRERLLSWVGRANRDILTRMFLLAGLQGIVLPLVAPGVLDDHYWWERYERLDAVFEAEPVSGE